MIQMYLKTLRKFLSHLEQDLSDVEYEIERTVERLSELRTEKIRILDAIEDVKALIKEE